MSRVLGFDCETTGLNPDTDRITEIGAVVWDTDTNTPNKIINELIYNIGDTPPSPEITALTGIKEEDLKEFGTPIRPNLEYLESICTAHKISHIVAHNGVAFDKPFLMRALDKAGLDCPTLRSLPWIDTRKDLPWVKQPDSNRLKHLALDCGFINPIPHRAITDVLTMLKVMSYFKFEDILIHAAKPEITIRFMTQHPKDDGGVSKDLAKSLGYKWQPAEVMWTKVIKEELFEQEKEKARNYQIVRLS